MKTLFNKIWTHIVFLLSAFIAILIGISAVIVGMIILLSDMVKMAIIDSYNYLHKTLLT